MKQLRRILHCIKGMFVKKKADEVTDDMTTDKSSKHDRERESEGAGEKKREALEASRDSQFGKKDIDRRK